MQQWMVSAIYGKERGGWSQEGSGTAEEDDLEEEIWEAWEEEHSCGDEEGDLCNLSDESVYFTDKTED